MDKLVVKEQQEFMGVRIPVIEGGFGEGQKVVLAKTVAQIHEVETKYINKVINNNIARFNTTDVRDLKTSSSKEPVLELGFTQAEYGNSKNIFVLSERGYTKLVSMMDNSNNKKWEVMDKLIDEYFSMRETIKSGQSLAQPKSSLELLELQVQALKEVKNDVQEVRSELEEFKGDLPLIGAEPEELQKVVRQIGTEALGGYKSPAYCDKSISAQVYSNVWKYVKDQFGVRKYKAIKRKYLEKAIEIAESYEAPFYLKEKIDLANSQIEFKEVD